MFRVILLQGKKYRIVSIIFLLLIPVSLVVGIDWDHHVLMMLVILIFGYYVYQLDYSFLQRRSSDRK
jgi:diacylglycerol kinase